METKIPTHMPAITQRGGSTINQLNPEIPIQWSDLAPSRLYSTIELDEAGVVSRRAIEGQKLLLPQNTRVTRFRVAACNNLGCGPVTLWTQLDKPLLTLNP